MREEGQASTQEQFGRVLDLIEKSLQELVARGGNIEEQIWGFLPTQIHSEAELSRIMNIIEIYTGNHQFLDNLRKDLREKIVGRAFSLESFKESLVDFISPKMLESEKKTVEFILTKLPKEIKTQGELRDIRIAIQDVLGGENQFSRKSAVHILDLVTNHEEGLQIRFERSQNPDYDNNPHIGAATEAVSKDTETCVGTGSGGFNNQGTWVE